MGKILSLTILSSLIFICLAQADPVPWPWPEPKGPIIIVNKPLPSYQVPSIIHPCP